MLILVVHLLLWTFSWFFQIFSLLFLFVTLFFHSSCLLLFVLPFTLGWTNFPVISYNISSSFSEFLLIWAKNINIYQHLFSLQYRLKLSKIRDYHFYQYIINSAFHIINMTMEISIKIQGFFDPFDNNWFKLLGK